MDNLNHEFGLDLKLKLDSYRKKKKNWVVFSLPSPPQSSYGEKKKKKSLKWVHELVGLPGLKT